MHNKALHLTAIPLRSIAVGELGRSAEKCTLLKGSVGTTMAEYKIELTVEAKVDLDSYRVFERKTILSQTKNQTKLLEIHTL